MKVCELLKVHQPTLSFEFFPPKTKEQEEELYQVITQLKIFSPHFVSVTYGALGTTRQKSFFWAKEIKARFQIEPLAHLTCVAATKEDITQQLQTLKEIGVENILALRGDPPEGQKDFVPPAGGFRFARQLIEHIKTVAPHFCLGVAGYPEGHPEAPNLEKNIEYLKQKIEAGGEFIITQLFFENRYFFDFQERCRRRGITVPILAGIMPITNYKQIRKMTKICGATIPPELLAKLEKYQADEKAIKEIGVEKATSQCQELLKAKVSGLHFFVLNQAEPVSQILREVL